MSQNPYESPQNPQDDNQDGEYEVSVEERKYARTTLLIPAIALILLASLDEVNQVRLTILGMHNLEQVRVGPLGVLLGSGIRMLLQLTVIVGGFNMVRLKSYGMTMIAALISIIPICSPLACFGIPFGIWALIVLRNPRVQEAFG